MTPEGFSAPPSEHKRPTEKPNRFHISTGSSHDASYFESVESRPLATRHPGLASSAGGAPEGGPGANTEGDSLASRLNSFATPRRSGDPPFPGDAVSEEDPGRRAAPLSIQPSGASAAHVDEENAATARRRKRSHSPTSWPPDGRPPQGSSMHRCHTFHLFHKSNTAAPRDEDASQSQSLDPPAREMFLEFFERNLREQKRYGSQMRSHRGAMHVTSTRSSGIEQCTPHA